MRDRLAGRDAIGARQICVGRARARPDRDCVRRHLRARGARHRRLGNPPADPRGGQRALPRPDFLARTDYGPRILRGSCNHTERPRSRASTPGSATFTTRSSCGRHSCIERSHLDGAASTSSGRYRSTCRRRNVSTRKGRGSRHRRISPRSRHGLHCVTSPSPLRNAPSADSSGDRSFARRYR